MFWRKPVTHAAALWILVGLAAGGLIAVMAYLTAIAHLRKDVIVANPPKSGVMPAEQPPTLFGTVVAFDGTILKVDSRQPYDEIIIESDTTIRTVGGSSVAGSELKPGAVVTATGKDMGDRRLSAYAIVILENR